MTGGHHAHLVDSGASWDTAMLSYCSVRTDGQAPLCMVSEGADWGVYWGLWVWNGACKVIGGVVVGLWLPGAGSIAGVSRPTLPSLSAPETLMAYGTMSLSSTCFVHKGFTTFSPTFSGSLFTRYLKTRRKNEEERTRK